jgi:hypothetical protein
MVKVEFRCPNCNKTGKFDVDEELLKQTERGVLAVTIPTGKICSHSFIAYVDKNYVVRDCFSADFSIEIPELIEEESEEIIIPKINVSEIKIIKFNLPASVIIYVIRAIFLKKKILLVTDKKHLYNHYYKFFDYIMQNSLDKDLSFTTKNSYMLKRKDFREFVVIGDNKEIIQDIDKICDLKKLKIEKNIVHKFFKNIDLSQSLIILKNEINIIYNISKKIAEIAEKHQLNKEIDPDTIHESLKDINMNKLQSDLLNLLIEIVEGYFGVQVSMSLKVILKKWKKKEKNKDYF